MKKALIIGGGGFIGSNITHFLLENRDYNIDIIDNFSRSVSGKVPLLEKYHESDRLKICLLYTSPSPRDRQKSRMPSSA